ncbi:tetratricopeptide repeat protein [Kitasatospora sp. NPDC049285]|uniref:tetratricopeptide repeat protein n=1 Tax=Kitasatospora sp. NPDC049285 TaxID=3157096 RepID=UPI00341B6052
MSTEASGERSVAAQHVTNAFTGDVSTVALPPEVLNAARDIQAPPGLSNLAPVPVCVGREVDLGWLERTLATGGGTAITQTPAVHGLGGIGKTTLALAYAHRHRGEYGVIWWINADSPARIEQSLGALALKLFPAWAGRAAPDERCAWATTWLQWHPGWLLVFDNAEAPADLDPYLGALSGGHHLITTRRATGWPHSVPAYALGTLAPDEATDLLCSSAFPGGPPTPHEQRQAAVLAAELGYLPLALEQAGGYLRQNPATTVDAYRERLARKLDKAADGIDAERTIARIWTQTLRALAARNPLAVDTLRTLAWLAPDYIPVALLEDPGADPDDLHEALGLLGAYTMATVTRHAVSVHRLVQTVLRVTAPTEPDGSPAGRRAAEQALLDVLVPLGPPTGNAAALWDVLMPQLFALAGTRPAGHRNDAVDALYDTAAQYLRVQGHEAHTVVLRQANLAHAQEVLGDAHPDTLAAVGNLAHSYHMVGDLDRAVPLYRTVLARRAQALGDTHPDLLTTRANLAAAYAQAGELDSALPLYEALLPQVEEVFGATHPDSLGVRRSLSVVRAAMAGRPHEPF